jgi:4-amino-4-deoxy-L-arabinose transferase-like glycosyltransferase
VRVPIFRAPDEPGHYQYVLFLSNRHRLPLFRPGRQEVPWEGHQPPLYYALATAALQPSGLLARSDHELALLRWAAEATGQVSPTEWRPSPADLRAVGLLRLFSAAFSTLTVLAVFLVARVAFPGAVALPLLAAGAVAFWPQFTFMGGAINNDSLANALCAFGLLLMAAGVSRREISPSLALAAGLVCGAGLLTKMLTFFLVPTFLAALALAGGTWRRSAKLAIVFAVSALVVCGWWLLWRQRVQGEVVGLGVAESAFGGMAVRGGLLHPYNVWYWTQRFPLYFFTSLWGRFGWMDRPLPAGAYVGFAVLSAGGLFGWAIWIRSRKLRERVPGVKRCFCLLASGLGLLMAEVIAFNLKYYQPQGRYLFGAISALAIFLCLGWAALATLLGRRRSAGANPLPRVWAAWAVMAGVNALMAFSSLAS